MPRPFALLVATVCLLLPAAASAQRAVLRGLVVTADSAARPVRDVDVVLGGTGRAARTADDGTFRFDGLTPGTYDVTARRLGFAPVTRRAVVSADGDTVRVTLPLAVAVQALAPVAVSDAGSRTPAALPRAAERARALERGGAFIDAVTLAQSENSTMSNVLRRVSGLTLVRVEGNARGYMALGTRRGGRTFRSGGDPNCYFQIYLDGQRYWAPDASGGAPPPDIDEFKPVDFEGVEVYRGPAQTPNQFSGVGATCGTVLFWSRMSTSR